jgi:hypothetical protein
MGSAMTIALGILGIVMTIWSVLVLNTMLGTVARSAQRLAALGTTEPLDIGNSARMMILACTAAFLIGLVLLGLAVVRFISN